MSPKPHSESFLVRLHPHWKTEKKIKFLGIFKLFKNNSVFKVLILFKQNNKKIFKFV